jgi:NADH-quinone oxidoreductase subunit M
MQSWPLLSLTTFLPLVGVLLILLFARRGDEKSTRLARHLALWSSVGVFVFSLLLLQDFDQGNTSYQFMERLPWMPQFGISYILGIDGISLWFVLMSTFLTPICVLASWKGIQTRVAEFMIALLVLETMMIGMFSALDFVLFYLFFEGVLIPMFLIVGVWGGPGRVVAAYRLFLFTFLGSVFMLLAILLVYSAAGTTDMTRFAANSLPLDLQKWVWVGFFMSFAVKSPMWPFHTWLPYAHVEAPTAGSVILAGVLLKMGGYGVIRILVQMLPDASISFAPVVLTLSVIAIIYTSLVALVQTDLKKLIAYSSVAHMGYVTLGAFSFTQQGLDGAMMVMLSHTVVASALFLCVGVVYDRLHTREIARYGGMAHNMPLYAAVFMIFTMASVGLPGTSGFVGEFLSMQGAFIANSWMALLAATGVVLGAAYMLWLYRRLFYGPLDKPDVMAMKDLGMREIVIFAPLLVLVLWMGIAPAGFRDVFAPNIETILMSYQGR